VEYITTPNLEVKDTIWYMLRSTQEEKLESNLLGLDGREVLCSTLTLINLNPSHIIALSSTTDQLILGLREFASLFVQFMSGETGKFSGFQTRNQSSVQRRTSTMRMIWMLLYLILRMKIWTWLRHKLQNINSNKNSRKSKSALLELETIQD